MKSQPALFTRYEQQRMALARQAKTIARLEVEIAALRSVLYSPHALDAALYKARSEFLEAENRLLRQANAGLAAQAGEGE